MMKHNSALFVKKIYSTCTLALLALVTPTTVFAQFDPSWVIAFLKETHRVAGRTIPVLLGVALLVFVWGVIKFIVSDDDRARGEGKRRMVWGVIGLFVIVSIWGLVGLMGTLLGIRGARAEAPQYYFVGAPPSSGSTTLPPCPRCCCNRTSPECIGATYSCSACSLSCN